MFARFAVAGLVFACAAFGQASPSMVTIKTNLTDSRGPLMTLSGSNCLLFGQSPAPQTFYLPPGSACTVQFALIDTSGPSARYYFQNWQDGVAANSRVVTGALQAMTYTANFRSEYLVSAEIHPANGGTVSGLGWVPGGSSVTVTATPQPGCRFLYWADGPHLLKSASRTVAGGKLIAVFAPLTTVLPAPYTVVAIAPSAIDSIRSGYNIPYSTRGVINDYGQITAMNGHFPSKAFVWTPSVPNGVTGTLTDLSAGTGFAVTDDAIVNAAGHVVGRAYQTAASNASAFAWTPSASNGPTGTTAILTSLPAPPLAFNDFGQIAGVSFLWTPAVANGTSGTLSRNNQFLSVIEMNNYGQVLMANMQLFTPSSLRNSSGAISAIPGLPGAYSSVARAMNNRGEVVGAGCSAAGCDAFIWTPLAPNAANGTTAVIPRPAGFLNLVPTAMNDRGDIVGLMSPEVGTSVPFLYSKGVVYDLSTVNAVLGNAVVFAINNAGQIVAGTAGSICLISPGSTPPAGFDSKPV